MIEIIFTKSNKIGSKLIRKVTGEKISHCAIRYKDYIVHSYLDGVTVMDYEEFAKINTTIYSVEIDLTADTLFKTLLDNSGKKYDYLALIGLGLRTLCKRCVPKVNIWQVSGMYLCTEFIAQYLYKQELLLTPYELYLKLKKENY